MIERDRFTFIREKYGLHASWAVWAEEGDTPKSNMDDVSIFEKEDVHLELNPEVVLVGLNFGTDISSWNPQKNLFQNFHWKGGGDFKVRYAVRNTPFWGAYMTDIIKDFPELVSTNVMSYLRKNQSVVDENIVSFKEELQDIGASNPILVGFGNDAYNILRKNLGTDLKIVKALHYAHYISKEKYREHIKQLIEDLDT
tara:strand:- start:162 stop:755 length:594 start_codon:yes stop_codon:yes gene_type:complete